MYDLEGINKVTSETQRSMELSESAKDYFNEVIPTAEEWNSMSESEKAETQGLIVSRMQEICDLTGVREADVAKHIPQYVFSINSSLEHKELMFCDEEEYSNRSEWAVQEFYENDKYRDIPYAEADIRLRAAYMEDFYDKFSEFSGYNSKLVFENKPYGNWGAYNPENNTISVNEKLLYYEDPEELMKTILHESRHAYQQYAVDYPDKVTVPEETIDLWRENMDNYISPELDYEEYVNQPIEVDANSYAEDIFNKGYSNVA